MTSPPALTDETAVSHILAAAIQDIAKQGIPGHDQEAAHGRVVSAPYVLVAQVSYAVAREGGKTPRGAVRDAVLSVLKRYRQECRLGEYAP